jgi:hypothetical protein
MNFVGNVMKNVDGIATFYIIGILIFMSLFVIVVYRTVKIPRKDLNEFKSSIFEKEELESTDTKPKS